MDPPCFVIGWELPGKWDRGLKATRDVEGAAIGGCQLLVLLPLKA